MAYEQNVLQYHTPTTFFPDYGQRGNLLYDTNSSWRDRIDAVVESDLTTPENQKSPQSYTLPGSSVDYHHQESHQYELDSTLQDRLNSIIESYTNTPISLPSYDTDQPNTEAFHDLGLPQIDLNFGLSLNFGSLLIHANADEVDNSAIQGDRIQSSFQSNNPGCYHHADSSFLRTMDDQMPPQHFTEQPTTAFSEVSQAYPDLNTYFLQ
jgi:hypothetical protein